MPADMPGRCLRVQAGGLAQLGATCQTLGASLAGAAGVSFVAVSGWQCNAGAVNRAAATARKDLGAITARIAGRGGRYSAAGGCYAGTDRGNAAALGELVR
ncbi:hypothetical protein MSM1_13165 [Mycobacterium sp. SM1]|uniref:hypothetical protein n=1 Tax=Mycobacterium sp. SM1 TaxID=2816243 RepID=UPI001BCAE31E|nr:hypothetical protein [Mycobacterium sp. SM1]MBS4729247.1 hypothetical protein [Mycobacterium sp. SM1]